LSRHPGVAHYLSILSMTIDHLMQQIQETARLITVYCNANDVIVGDRR